MALVGGDAPALFGFANELRRRRANIEATTRKLGSLVAQANWVGPDREKFLSEWNGRHAAALMTVVQELGEAASQVSYHAQQQERASRS